MPKKEHIQHRRKKLQKESGGDRPTIGFFLDNINIASVGTHQTRVWNAVDAAAQETDANLICFLGGALGYSPINEFEHNRNVVYDLATAHRVDGVIISSTLGDLIPYEAFCKFCSSFQPLPVVSLGTPLPGIPSIVVQYTIMRDLITHFIEVHGHRRIGFIRGPETSTSAEKRYKAYLEVLATYNIPFNPDLVAPGNFLPGSGAAAIDLLLDERKLCPGKDLQAIIAANDNMALGAMEALQKRGLHVPVDVAVAGVDDIEEARVSIPSLTTIRHAVHEMVRQAVKALLALIAGEEVPEQILIPEADLIVRQSCGCFYKLLQQITKAPVATTKTTMEKTLNIQRKLIISKLEQAFSSIAMQHPVAEWAARLMDTFIAGLKKEAGIPNPFLYSLDIILRQVTGDDDLLWHEVMSVLRHYVFPLLEEDTVARAISLWQQAWILIGNKKRQIETRKRLKAEQHAEILRDVSQALLTTFDISSLMEVTAQRLPLLGIERCFISLYEYDLNQSAGLNFTSHMWGRLILAFEGNRRIKLKKNQERFPVHQIVPHGLLPLDRRYHLLVDTLYFRDEQFGLIVFEIRPPGGIEYATLRMQISAALKVAFLQKNRKQAEQNLARSNRDLEQFAYIASHDLQEPLRMVTSYLQLLERRYQGQIDAEADTYIDSSINGAKQMQLLIRDLLRYSRVTTQGKSFKPTDCNKALKQAQKELKFEIEKSGTVITSDTLPEVMADGIQLVQVFQNLISNAIKFQDKRTPEIHVGVQRRGREWLFFVRDNGIGISLEYLEQIFVIFKRLHSEDRYKGTGVGLALCKKIVERHGGIIWAESEPDKGSLFYFTIPVNEKAIYQEGNAMDRKIQSYIMPGHKDVREMKNECQDT
jgi:signal transduction histidine kinase/DNA-binding LacI/PurR family transcriptional regulator